jgi:hypothetical protein
MADSSTSAASAPSQPPIAAVGEIAGHASSLADKLLSGVGLAAEEMPFAGALLKTIAGMFATFHQHMSGAGQQ